MKRNATDTCFLPYDVRRGRSRSAKYWQSSVHLGDCWVSRAEVGPEQDPQEAWTSEGRLAVFRGAWRIDLSRVDVSFVRELRPPALWIQGSDDRMGLPERSLSRQQPGAAIARSR